MTIARPSYLTRQLRRTLAPWVESVTGLPAGASGAVPRVVWAEQNLPRPELPYVSLRRLGSASDTAQTQTFAGFPVLTQVRVLTTTVDDGVSLRLNYGAPGYVVRVGDAIEDVRDGLIAAILAGSDPVDAQITAPDTFTVAGLAGVALSPVEGLENVETTPLALDTVEIREMTRTTTVRLEAWAFDDADDRALDYLDALVADIGRAQTAAFFASRGVSIVGTRPTAQDSSALSGGERETRAFVDLQVAQWTRHFEFDPEVVDSIDLGPGLAKPEPSPPVVGIEVVGL